MSRNVRNRLWLVFSAMPLVGMSMACESKREPQEKTDVVFDGKIQVDKGSYDATEVVVTDGMREVPFTNPIVYVKLDVLTPDSPNNTINLYVLDDLAFTCYKEGSYFGTIYEQKQIASTECFVDLNYLGIHHIVLDNKSDTVNSKYCDVHIRLAYWVYK